MRLLLLVLCFTYFTYIQCEENNPPIVRPPLDGRILGGEDVNITEVPYQVSVQISGRHICGGAIIASNVIVTAAHCIMDPYLEKYSIRAGSSYSNLNGVVKTVKEIVKYPTFTSSTLNGDVAVLWLSNELEFSDKVASIEMTGDSEKIHDGDLMTVTGWGRLSENGPVPDMLQKVLVPKVSDLVCNDVYRAFTANMLCAGYIEGEKDSCQGDSGGPLVYKNKLAGIVSFGRGCGRPKVPGVYAKVSALKSWIDSTVEQLRSKHAESSPIRPELDGKIVGGEPVNITEVPYQVSVQLSRDHICGGTIIASDVILTAAHCIIKSKLRKYSIRAGSSYNDHEGVLKGVKEIVKYPNFQPSTMNGDVAVLYLANPLEFSDKIAPIKMKETDEEIPDGDLMAVTGWGDLSEEGGPEADMLQKVLVPKVSEAVCNGAYHDLTFNMLCAGYTEGRKDSCQGDSGGPLVHDKKLAGVVSFGHGCARPNIPGVYARVSALRSWIDSTIGELRLKYAPSTKQ